MDHVSSLATKVELDNAIPFHMLLDISPNRSRAKLAHKGMLTTRHRPSEKSLRGAIRKKSRHLSNKSNCINMVRKKYFCISFSLLFQFNFYEHWQKFIIFLFFLLGQ